MILFKIMRSSLVRRKVRLVVSTLALAFSVMLLLTLVHIDAVVHRYAKHLSASTDLVVGAPAQSSHLVLYSLFGIGTPPPDLPSDIYNNLRDNPEVSRAVAVSVRESHRGFVVTGVTSGYFDMLHLNTEAGDADGSTGLPSFSDRLSVLIGSNVATSLKYKEGELLTVAAGFMPSYEDEYQTRFVIQQILPATGTTIDDTILVPIEGLTFARAQHGLAASNIISYIMVKLHNRQALLAMQQVFSRQAGAPVEVAIPAVELQLLTDYEEMINTVMMAMIAIISALALVMVFFNLSASFAERRQELELLRMVGARPIQIASLTLAEPVGQVIVAIIIGTLSYFIACAGLHYFFPAMIGLELSLQQVSWLLLVFMAGFSFACLPAWKIYAVSRRI
ncbi:ABC transporter permease [Spongorhabdus nitratireducens]